MFLDETQAAVKCLNLENLDKFEKLKKVFGISKLKNCLQINNFSLPASPDFRVLIFTLGRNFVNPAAPCLIKKAL